MAGREPPSRAAAPPPPVTHVTRARALAGLALLAGCKGTAPELPQYIVSYALTASVQISCDSVKYKNAEGTVIKVTAPTLPWSVAYLGPTGTFVAGTAWMTA